MIKKTIKNISFGKSSMYRTLSKSLLWGNFKNYNTSIAEKRNLLLHHDMFMHMRLPETYSILNIFQNYRHEFYIQIMALFFIYIYYVSHYIISSFNCFNMFILVINNNNCFKLKNWIIIISKYFLVN